MIAVAILSLGCPKGHSSAARAGATQNSAPEKRIKNPYREATKKFLVANALLGGEVDRGKVVRECGMKLNTVYNVTGELAQMGYVLPIHQKTKKRVTPPLSPPTTSPHPPPQTTQNATPGGSGVASEAASPQSTQQNATQGVTQQPPSESPQQLPPDFLDQMADKIVERFGVKPPPRVQPELPGKELPSARCFQA